MKCLSLSLLVATTALLSLVVPAASANQREHHCYVRVIERKASGELVTTDPSCFATEAEAEEAGVTSTASPSARSLGTFALATHYDGPSWTGSSTTVVGDDCNGGWLNTSAYWAAQMESTKNQGCTTVRHFYNTNLGGTSYDTLGSGGNLNATLTHHAWSVQYL